MEKADLRQEIWQKRMEFARDNSGEYPDSLILSRDMHFDLLKECEPMLRAILPGVGKYMGMDVCILADHREKGIIKVAITN